MSQSLTVKELHSFTGHPGEFWPEFFTFACQQLGAARAILLERNDAGWKLRYQWPPGQQQPLFSSKLPAELSTLAEQAHAGGQAAGKLSGSTGQELFAQRLEELDSGRSTAAIFFVEAKHDVDPDQLLQKLSLLSDTPQVYLHNRAVRRAEEERDSFADTLELLLQINDEEHFLAAAMLLVNETAARNRCTRVSLGWKTGDYLKLQAISHMENFEPKMDIVGSLEAAMEETLDQDTEIVLPQPRTESIIIRDHSEYARQQQSRHLLSLPLRIQGDVAAVLLCERQDTPFSQQDVDRLRILCDQVACRLEDLRLRGRPLRLRCRDALKEKTSSLLGAEQTLLKLMTLVCVLLFFAAAVVKLPYRIEAPFIVRSKDVRQVAAPFEGYIDEVHVKIGQQVAEDELLLALDTRDLLLEESAAIANQLRYLREAEKARAFSSLIEMKIAEAQADQAKAQLELVRHRLSQAEMLAPINGIIVEGDLEQLRGAPVAKGDILFKIARHETLFVEIKVAEQDFHEVAVGQKGELAFVSRPQLKFPIEIDQLDPAALVEEKGNVFLVRDNSLQKSEPWWRPGMSGVAKIDVDRRSLLWIATHRTVDFFQMLVWW